MLTRRSVLGGVLGLLAAPAIVRASSLMPVRMWLDDAPFDWSGFYSLILPGAGEAYVPFDWSESAAIIRKAFIPQLFVHLYRESPVLTLLTKS